MPGTEAIQESKTTLMDHMVPNLKANEQNKQASSNQCSC